MEDEKKKRPISSYFGVELDISKMLKDISTPGHSIIDYLDFFVSTPAVQRVVMMEAAPNIDMSNIRAEDRPYIHEVIQYLRQNGLRTELKGSATESKEYNDIDILAKGSLEDVVNTVCGFIAIELRDPKVRQFYKTAADGKEYTVTSEGVEVRYMNTNIAQLFRIVVGDTKIHVGLKADPDPFRYSYRSAAAA